MAKLSLKVYYPSPVLLFRPPAWSPSCASSRSCVPVLTAVRAACAALSAIYTCLAICLRRIRLLVAMLVRCRRFLLRVDCGAGSWGAAIGVSAGELGLGGV